MLRFAARALILAIALALFGLQHNAPAAQDVKYSDRFEYKEYIVKKGDTLWSISRRELEDGFQWPMIWKENLRINNPDLIYPGDVIVIPFRFLGAAGMPVGEGGGGEVEAGGPVDTGAGQVEAAPTHEPVRKDIAPGGVRPLLTRQMLIKAGYITKIIPDAGRITGAPNKRTTFGTGDEIYVDTDKPAEEGQKFYVLKKLKEVEHPSTGKDLGWQVKVVGTIVLEESGTRRLKAKVIEMFDTLDVGDPMDYYYDINPPFLSGEARMPQIKGYVVAHERIIEAQFDLIHLDKGSKNGLKMGDKLITLYRDTDDKRNCIMQIVNLRPTTSLALILISDFDIQAGDQFRGELAENLRKAKPIKEK